MMTNITINRVLEAIVKGNYSGKAISDYTGINKSNLSRYLHFLENIDFIYLSVNKKAEMRPKGTKFYFENTTSSVSEKIIRDVLDWNFINV